MMEVTKPAIVAFEITRRCVLRCRHCRAVAQTDTADVLLTEQCRRILQSVADLRKCVVVLTGGEPMTRPDVFELVEYGKSIGHRMALATCGVSLDEEAVRRLKQAGLFSFSFSLDGANEKSHDAFRRTPGAFAMTVKAIELARKDNVRFQINTTITALNVDKLDEIAWLAVALGAACWNPFMLVPVGRAGQDKDLFLSPRQYETALKRLAEMKTSLPIELRVTCGPQFARVARQKKIAGAENVKGCRAADGFAFISYKGDVQPCGFLEISAGNLLENKYNLADIWHHSPLLNTIRDFSAYRDACGKCEFLAHCRGCRARAYAETGDILGCDPMCFSK
jgi:radical SAM protein with 4Fe4S-binding SPASM domain